MREWEKRFEGIAPEKKRLMLKELEEHVALRGSRMLTTDEIEDLLLLLPSNYFVLLQRLKIKLAQRFVAEFPEVIANFNEAASSLIEACRELLPKDQDNTEREEFIKQMADLRIYHPALWFKVYRTIVEENMGWAAALEPSDKNRKFLSV